MSCMNITGFGLIFSTEDENVDFFVVMSDLSIMYM